MIRSRLLGFSALTAVCLATPNAAFAQADPDLRPVIEATVRVEAVATGRSGTGWVIEAADAANRAGAAVIVTALNVIEGSPVIRVSATGQTYDAIVRARDPDRNLAFLEVKDITAAPIPIARGAPNLGGTVFAAGYNRAADDSERAIAATATSKRGSLGREYRGAISTEASADVNQLEHDAAMISGFEGGPLVDLCGRVVGINMKSGGEVVPRADMRIANGATIMNALKSDEVIASANAYGFDDYDDQNGACGGPAQPPPTPTPDPTPPPESSEGIIAWMSDKVLLIALLLLGLVAALFGIMTLTRRKSSPYEDGANSTAADFPPSRLEPMPASSETEVATILIGESRSATTKEAELRLTGRGPSGEPIDMRFTRSELTKGSVMLGVGANAERRIPDNRGDHKVSRMHARIGVDASGFFIEDNKSTNKTKVSGRQIEPHTPTPLVHGDTLTLADVELAVSIQ